MSEKKMKAILFVPYEIQSKHKKWPFTEAGYRLEEQEITSQRPKKRKRRARSKDGLDIRRE